ncbi:related to allantoate permease [Serendipita indica DSM 11827]|uniref:Related to allantoate permease n=1 Tax=Serendipita indica (strain DSM 11827) TaxID=1109443 RepID=G4T9K8_SERID|nr:related to allantoate permease [Serendipita indica DSM 11827]
MASEKEKMTHVDVTESTSKSSSSIKERALEGQGFDAQRTKALLWKLDRNIVPFLALLYLIAQTSKLETSLNMKGLDYNNALAIFFPFYVAAEVPSNIMLKRTRPAFWFSLIMVLWALSTVVMGFVKTYHQLLALRAILGFFEGGLFPGVNFYITTWYRRHECGLRMAIFFSAATAAGAFGGLLARGITEMHGKGGLEGWSWIFILEGILTFIVAVWAYFQIHDFPHTAKFLAQDERDEVQRRLTEDRTSLADEFSYAYVKDALTDWKIWVHMIATFGIYTALYSISLFLPTIIKSMGYKDNKAQLMTVPPYVVACVFTISGGFAADRYKQRGIFMIGFCLLALTGMVMLISSANIHVQYAGTFLAASGIYANVPGGVAWNSNNIGGSTKRAVGLGLHVAFGNLGGVLASYLFQSKDAPRYKPGFAVLIGMHAMSVVLCIFMTIYLRYENARRDRVARENGWPLKAEEYTHEMREAERTKGDNASFFRYTI